MRECVVVSNRGQSRSKEEAECDLKTLSWSFSFFLTAKEETSCKDATNFKTADILGTTTLALLYCLSVNVEVIMMESCLDE